MQRGNEHSVGMGKFNLIVAAGLVDNGDFMVSVQVYSKYFT